MCQCMVGPEFLTQENTQKTPESIKRAAEWRKNPQELDGSGRTRETAKTDVQKIIHCTFESAAVLEPRAVARRGSTEVRYRHEKIDERRGFGARRVKNNTRARSCQCSDTVGISAGIRHELTVDDNPDGHCVEVEGGLQGTQRKRGWRQDWVDWEREQGDRR
ncbi:hypothetical protein C8R46DRAFT_1050207 [Mycena filopes]|nr:hypothetical protein C8R46DRAFT_1050207 [Mycena filopes]